MVWYGNFSTLIAIRKNAIHFLTTAIFPYGNFPIHRLIDKVAKSKKYFEFASYSWLTGGLFHTNQGKSRLPVRSNCWSPIDRKLPRFCHPAPFLPYTEPSPLPSKSLNIQYPQIIKTTHIINCPHHSAHYPHDPTMVYNSHVLSNPCQHWNKPRICHHRLII